MVGLPLTSLEFIHPVGDETLHLSGKFAEDLMKAVANLTERTTALQEAKDLIALGILILTIAISVLVAMAIEIMHSDTVERQNERVRNAAVIPPLVLAMGATRKFGTKVIDAKGSSRMGVVAEKQPNPTDDMESQSD